MYTLALNVVVVVLGYYAMMMWGFFRVSQSAALAAPPATDTRSSTVGQALATAVVDRPRPSNEDIVKAFRLATEDQQPVVAQDAVFDTNQPAIARPVPLPKRRPLPRP